MFPDVRRYPWKLDIYKYASLGYLLGAVHEHAITPAEAKVAELRAVR